MKKIIGGVILLILVFIGWILYNTFSVKAWPSSKAEPLPPLPDSAIRHFSDAIKIATVSLQDANLIDTPSFTAYRSFLEKTYPLLHQQASRDIVAGYSYVYTWKGSDSSLQPIILMAHYDVVPVEPSAVKLWTVQPFGGEVRNDSIWGRGAADDKGSMIAILEAAEALMQKGYKPKRTILLCFGHNEESTGTGAKAIVEWLKQRNVRAELVVDEGGEITLEGAKGVSRPVATIGVGEKGYVTFEVSVQRPGGHSSTPEHETAIDILARALYKMRGKKTPRTLLPSTKEYLERVSGSSTSFIDKMAVNNLWMFEGLVVYRMGNDRFTEAMISSTIVPTMLESGIRENVIPSNARAIVNSRIQPGETARDVEDFIRSNIDDDRVLIKKTGDFVTDPTPSTDFKGAAFRKVAAATAKVMDDVIPVPYVLLGATDSRSYRAISDGVITFCPMIDTKGYHGIDERVGISDMQRAFAFYTILMKDEAPPLPKE